MRAPHVHRRRPWRATALLASLVVAAACAAPGREAHDPGASTGPTTAVPSSTAGTTSTSAPPTTTTRSGLVAAGVAFKQCAVTDAGCIVADPGREDVIAGAPVPMPVPDRDGLPYGPLPEQRLDVYLPAGRAQQIVVFFHAGGWTSGNRRAVPYTILHELTRGRAVISVDYRLAPASRWPAQMQDADRAIRWIRLHGADWGLASLPIVVSGASAGGHLALFAAAAAGHLVDPSLPAELRAIDPRVAGVVALAAPAQVASMLDHDWGPPLLQALLGCSFDCAPQVFADASPATHLTDAAPPVFLAVGEHDPLVPPDVNLVALAAAWVRATGPRRVWVDLVHGAEHNIDVNGVNVTALDEFLGMAMES